MHVTLLSDHAKLLPDSPQGIIAAVFKRFVEISTSLGLEIHLKVLDSNNDGWDGIYRWNRAIPTCVAINGNFKWLRFLLIKVEITYPNGNPFAPSAS